MSKASRFFLVAFFINMTVVLLSTETDTHVWINAACMLLNGVCFIFSERQDD